VNNGFALNTEAAKKAFVRRCQSNHLFPTLVEKIQKGEWEIIGSFGTGWKRKVDSLADLFGKTNKSLFEDQKRVVAALLNLQEVHPEEIIFLTENRFLKEFIQGVFQDFFPKKNFYFGDSRDFKTSPPSPPTGGFGKQIVCS
jgi:hypothetical protein